MALLALNRLRISHQIGELHVRIEHKPADGRQFLSSKVLEKAVFILY
jgi:hypothetical protein